MTGSGKGKRQGRPGAGPVTERKLDAGWAAVPGVRVRQALAADMDAVRELAPLAGVTIDDELADAVAAGTAGLALRAGLARGRDGFSWHLAQEVAAHPDHPLIAYLSAALVLVAEHRDHGIVGTVAAYPPPNIAQAHLEAVGPDAGPDVQELLLLSCAAGLSRVRALAVAGPMRGLHVGSALLLRCRQVFFACGYAVVYGQMPPTPGLDAFYRSCGFEVLAPGEKLDLWPVFGVHSHIGADPGERFFIRYRPGG